MGTKYIINFCRSTPPGFRSAEMNGLSKVFGFHLDAGFLDESKPYAIVELDDENIVRLILSRSVLVKTISELLVTAENYKDLHMQLKSKNSLIEYMLDESKTFSVWIDGLGKKLNQGYKINRIEELAFLKIRSQVKLDNPDVCLYLLEYYGQDANNVPEHPYELHFGRLIGKGHRDVPGTYLLRTRKCIGNTSMDPLLSFIAANIAAVSPNDFVLDPFVGTGSLLLPAAHFGAYCLGCDINYNLLHGAGKSSREGVKFRCKEETVKANFEQYGLVDKYVDILIADSSRPKLWRFNGETFFHAIITDPPYGIRETSRKVGAKVNEWPDQGLGKNHPLRIPSKVQYSFVEVFLDLLNFASECLVLNGRLVFWFPIIYKNFDEEIIPQHSCLKRISTCEERLSSNHGRLLICMEKIKHPTEDDKAYVLKDNLDGNTLRNAVLKPNLNF